MNAIRRVSLLLTVCLLCGFGLFAGLPADAADPLDMSMTLRQVGNQLFNGRGEAVRLLGVNVPQTSWSATGDGIVRQALDVALTDYQSNCIRLPITSRFWLHGQYSTTEKDENGDPKQLVTAKQYRDLIDELVAKVAKAGKYIIVELHGFYMPQDSDFDLWKSVAVHYKDHPNVIYGLFNEPVVTGDWRTFLEGGPVKFEGVTHWGEIAQIDIVSKGIPALAKALRATGAGNLMTISGLDWGYDLMYMTEGRMREFAGYLGEDQGLSGAALEAFCNEYIDKYYMGDLGGNGVMFETHPYPERQEREDHLHDTLMEFPVLVGECGPTETRDGFIRKLSENDQYYLDTLAAFMDKYEMHLTAWALGAWPHLSQYPGSLAPSAYGSFVMNYIDNAHKNLSVTLFQGADYQGAAVTLNPGKYTASTLKAKGFDLTKLASAMRKEGSVYQYVIDLYEKADYTGKTYQIMPNAKSFSIGFVPQSVKITRITSENLLPGMGKVTVSGATDGTTGKELIDGNYATCWQSTVSAGSVATIELDGLYALTGIGLAHAGEAGKENSNVSAYTISVSTNGKLFTRIIDVTGVDMGLTTYTFDQVVAKYVRVHVRKGNSIEPELVILGEVMAYGAPYTGDPQKLPEPIKLSNTGPGNNETPAVTDPPVTPEETTQPEETGETTGTTGEPAAEETAAPTTQPAATTQPTKAAGNTGGGLPVWAIVLIVAGAVLVVGGGVTALLVYSKKKKAA